jgi:hypothetical protein
MNVEVEHIIDDTSKEIYIFKSSGNNCWEYKGIKFSNRSNKREKWGEDWGKVQLKRDLNRLGRKFLRKHEEESIPDILKKYNSIAEAVQDEYVGRCESLFALDNEIERLRRKWNPVCNKTRQGETRLHGLFFGRPISTKSFLRPKLSEKILIDKIKKEITKNVEIKM